MCCFFLFESLNLQNIAKDLNRKKCMFNVSRGSSISSRSEMCIKMLNAQTKIDIDNSAYFSFVSNLLYKCMN